MRRLLAAAAFAVAAVAQQPRHEEAGGQHRHRERTAEEWVQVLERKDRDAWQKPDEVVAALGLESGQTVADIGAGSGYFAMRFGRAVGVEGKVYAVDIQQDLIDYLATRANDERLTNLIPTLATSDDPKLPAAEIDRIFICDVVHHIENRQAYYQKLAAALAPGGKIAIVDFYKRELPVGPGVEMKIAETDLIAEFERAGFEIETSHDFLPYQYFLVFGKR